MQEAQARSLEVLKATQDNHISMDWAQSQMQQLLSDVATPWAEELLMAKQTIESLKKQYAVLAVKHDQLVTRRTKGRGRCQIKEHRRQIRAMQKWQEHLQTTFHNMWERERDLLRQINELQVKRSRFSWWR